MGSHTSIQWADSTVNPATGCDGCELHVRGKGGPCYAGHYHANRMAKALPDLYDAEFTNVRLAPGRMAKAPAWPDLRGKPRPNKPWILPETPRLIFVSDMSDALSAAVPFDYLLSEVIEVARLPKGRRHRWLWLTKRPARMAEFALWLCEERGLAWPDNLWAGTSITGRKTETRADILAYVPARVKFLSIEPLVEPVAFAPNLLRNFELMIIGGESSQPGHPARPFDINWARDLIRQCRAVGVRPFVKQLGSNPYDSSRRISIDGPDSHALTLDLEDGHGGDWDEWPNDLKVRELPAMPEVADA